MEIKSFIVIGENIHCTRVLKRGGKLVGPGPDGRESVFFEDAGRRQCLPIPEGFLQGADWAAGKVRHCAAAIWQGLHGREADRAAGQAYLSALARRQEQAGAAFLDVNVDEFSLDLAERVAAMEWTAALVQQASALPLSIDSSHADIVRAGLRACDRARGRPMLNSISLERLGLLVAVAEFRPALVVSAAGEHGLPATAAERLANFRRLVPQLAAAGIAPDWMHLDPLVYTISTDSANGRIFLEAVSATRREFGPAIHVIGGLSNVSFGLPARKLINQVFAWLSVVAGGDGGIVDPLQLNAGVLNVLDPESEPFRLARALLEGADEFGLEFIAAHRDGRLGQT